MASMETGFIQHVFLQTRRVPASRSRGCLCPRPSVGVFAVLGCLVAACDVTPAFATGPLKVFILAGQSNMEGQARVTTFEHIGMDPRTAPLLREMLGPDGKPIVLEEVAITSIRGTDVGVEQCGPLTVGYGGLKPGPKIGPEYTFGITMHKALREPILIIKTAWGGKSLNHDFRPPSAGEWVPPAGHPDLVKKEAAPPLPIPDALDLPVGYVPGKEHLDPYAHFIGQNLGLGRLRGCSIGEHQGIWPIYVAKDTTLEAEDFPLKKGDVILGVNGAGFAEDPVDQWRAACQAATRADWMLRVTRWRDGKIESFDLDLAKYSLPGGRADIAKERAARAEARVAHDERTGAYYRLMIAYVKHVLGDIKRVCPAYDPAQGYELAGFVWFQGWNDFVDTYAYPNRSLPRGYDRYTWLLEHLIRDVRHDLQAPRLPFVIGVIGVGGPIDDPANPQVILRRAMAAPAEAPEFKGTVKSVLTERYWDPQLSDVAEKAARIASKRAELAKGEGLEGKALEDAVAAHAATVWTPEEEKIFKVGVSNKAFHYMGSAKILGQIGKAFAEAMLELQPEPRK